MRVRVRITPPVVLTSRMPAWPWAASMVPVAEYTAAMPGRPLARMLAS
jgi:hypothetical protein